MDVFVRAVAPPGTGEVLQVVKQYGGYDAVGMRLTEGENSPYFVQRGSRVEVVETFLCSGRGTELRTATND